MSTLDSYGKMNLVEQANHDAVRRSRRRYIIIGIASLAVVTIVIGAVAGALHNRSSSSNDSKDNPRANSYVKMVCASATYPDRCYGELAPLVSSNGTVDPKQLFQLSVRLAKEEVSRASAILDVIRGNATLDGYLNAALGACTELLQLSAGSLNDTLNSHDIQDLKTWLSSAMTYDDVCLDALQNVTEPVSAQVAAAVQNSTEVSSTSLSLLSVFEKVLGAAGGVGRRRKLLDVDSDGFPSWVSPADRKLLQEVGASSAAFPDDPRATADIVVAQDGSGGYSTISAAMQAVPAKSARRTVVYVKKGTYEENVWVDKSKSNVLLIGDGKDATIVTGKKNFVDGTPTYKTATFGILGKNFIVIDMGFVNTAGPAKHQAVALMASSDQTVFYRCKFDAFQDTLYTLAGRQLYRACDVYGTVDFIFGNAASVFQACNIYPRVPLPGQFVTITAQGKSDPKMNTGISIHQSVVAPFGDLAGVRVYLGRPWKAYSTTVVMKTVLTANINPEGWLAWSGRGGSAPSTIFYAEYMNTGPGSNTAGRVKWQGIRTLTDGTAAQYTVGPFLGSAAWLPQTKVPYEDGL